MDKKNNIKWTAELSTHKVVEAVNEHKHNKTIQQKKNMKRLHE